MNLAELGAEAPGHPEVVRVRAPNPGPLTLSGTNTYVVGRDPAWVIDPGPANAEHIERVREVAVARGGIGGVVLTHSHADHSAGVQLLGAGLDLGEAADRDEAAELARALGEAGGNEWAADAAGQRAATARWSASPALGTADALHPVGPFRVLPTPGHAADHVAFVLDDVCFCGDLILGEGSSIVPPAGGGGSLVDYLRSLAAVAALGSSLLCPGHGPWITDPAARIEEYVSHRRERERLLVEALDVGKRSQDELLDAAWADVPVPMRPAAAMALRAHLEKLEAEDRLPDDLEQ